MDAEGEHSGDEILLPGWGLKESVRGLGVYGLGVLGFGVVGLGVEGLGVWGLGLGGFRVWGLGGGGHLFLRLPHR